MLSYNKVTLYGDTYTDYIWVKDIVDTEININEINDYYYAPTWNGNTLLLATFDNNINAGNITSLKEDVLYWQIYKKEPLDESLSFITKVPASQYKLIDFNVLNKSEYQYIIFAETKNAISAPLRQVDYIKTNFFGWSIIGLVESDVENLYYVDQNNIWNFDTMFTSNNFDQNIDKYIMENFTQFPKISSGKKNYLSSSVTAFLSNVKDGVYQDTVEQYNRFVDFIAQPNIKLLRDRKGNGWLVSTIGNNMQYIDESYEQITKVSFNFVQLGDVHSVQIIGG